VFSNPVLGQIVADEIVASDQAGYSKTLAHVVMPNHIHWLLELTGDESLSRVVGRMKGRASRRIGTSGLSSGKVWQPGFYDRALRRNEDLYSAAHYVLNNPVRAGLVEHYSEYPLSYSVWEKPARSRAASAAIFPAIRLGPGLN